MITGVFKDGHPRATLVLDGRNGPISIEFIIDTGFEGDLALPGRLARQLDGSHKGFSDRLLASGMVVKVPVYEAVVDWAGERWPAEVLVMEGNPLIGTQFLSDYLLQVEMAEGGDVTAEPL